MTPDQQKALHAKIEKSDKMTNSHLAVAAAMVGLKFLPTDEQRIDLIGAALEFYRIAVTEDFIKVLTKGGDLFTAQDGADRLMGGGGDGRTQNKRGAAGSGPPLSDTLRNDGACETAAEEALMPTLSVSWMMILSTIMCIAGIREIGQRQYAVGTLLIAIPIYGLISLWVKP